MTVPLMGAGIELQVGEAGEQRPHRRPQLHAAHGAADAGVDAKAERQVAAQRLRVAVDAELPTVGQVVAVTVGRGIHHPDLGVGRDRATGDLGVGRGGAEQALHRRLEADHLLHGVVEQRPVRHQLGPLLGMGAEQPHGVPDGVGRGVAPRHQQDLAGHDQLDVVELALLVGREDEGREDVVGDVLPVAGHGPAPFDLDHEVLGELHERLERLLVGLGVPPEGRNRLLGPAPEQRSVAGRDAEHLADAAHGHGVGVVGGDVDLALGGEPVDQLVADRLDLGGHELDHPGAEPLAHDAPLAGVVGLVGVDEHADPVEGDEPLRARALPAGEAGGVLEDLGAVGVAHHRKELGGRPGHQGVGVDLANIDRVEDVVVDGAGLPQPLVVGVRVLFHRIGVRVVVAHTAVPLQACSTGRALQATMLAHSEQVLTRFKRGGGR